MAVMLLLLSVSAAESYHEAHLSTSQVSVLHEVADQAIDAAADGGLADWQLLRPQCQLSWFARKLQHLGVRGGGEGGGMCVWGEGSSQGGDEARDGFGVLGGRGGKVDGMRCWGYNNKDRNKMEKGAGDCVRSERAKALLLVEEGS
jgi:hypothetical protein